MCKLYSILSIFVLTVIIGIGIGVSSANAGSTPQCNSMDCTIECPTPAPDGSIICEGTSGNDIICGTYSADPDIIDAGKGNDTVCGFDGDDEIEGGKGMDNIFGGNGDDFVDGGMDNDTLNGEAGDDIVEGGKGEDNITGGDGDETNGDECYGGPQTDTFAGCECGEVGPTNGRSPQNGSEDPTLLEECELPI